MAIKLDAFILNRNKNGFFMENLNWIFFDVGSTLIDENKSYQDFIERSISLLEEHNIEVGFEQFYQMMLKSSKNYQNPLQSTWEQFSSSLKLDRPVWDVKNDRLFPCVRETLEELSKYYSLGIIANQIAGLEERLRKWEIISYFKIIVSSAEVGIYKPNPAIFQLALTKAKAKSTQCLYVGDRCDNDIIPAKRLGFKTVRILQGVGSVQAEDPIYPSDFQIFEISDLLTILGK